MCGLFIIDKTEISNKCTCALFGICTWNMCMDCMCTEQFHWRHRLSSCKQYSTNSGRYLRKETFALQVLILVLSNSNWTMLAWRCHVVAFEQQNRIAFLSFTCYLATRTRLTKVHKLQILGFCSFFLLFLRETLTRSALQKQLHPLGVVLSLNDNHNLT